MKLTALLVSIFIIGLTIRFAYFSENVYFSYDQARDAYFGLDILKGDLRLIGPPSAASPNLFPGPLSLYLYSAVLAFGKNPENLSIFFRVYNALGVFLVYLIASKMFDKRVGILSSLLFAVSYEQSQYSLFMSHQPLAVLPVLAFYLGLSTFVFEKKAWGLVLSLFGLGLAIHFHFVYMLLIPGAIIFFFLNRSSFTKLKFPHLTLAFFAFLLPISTYLLSEVKFDFRLIKSLFTASSNSSLHLIEVVNILLRFIHNTLFANTEFTIFASAFLILGFDHLILNKSTQSKGILLFIWLLGGLLPYLFSGTTSYYYSASATVSLLILASFVALETLKKYSLVGLTLVAIIILNNILLIKNQNPKGPNRDIVIQEGMTLTNETAALAYIYENAEINNFSIKALTVPLNVATTWNYLIEWYGKEYYGYLPIWSEKPAEGFPGALPYQTARSELPETQFIIIEPTTGIDQGYIENYFKEESYFTKLVEEKQFGTIRVQKRLKI